MKRFVFEFTNEETEETTAMLFMLEPTTDEARVLAQRIEDNDEDADDDYTDFIDKMEADYGVHDVGFNPETDLIGFNTYEVESDKYLEVMNKWKSFYERRGFKTTEIQQTTNPWL